MLRVFTAFSGYDSQCLALKSIGIKYRLVGWSEIDKYAIKAHDALFPQWAKRNYGDISKIDWSKVPDFDLFTYSSPCQDFSQAGKQRGATKGSGTRSSLLWECERAIEAKRPKYLLFENVSAVASSKFVKLFNEWQLTLERLGYTNFTQVLNAKTHGYPTPVPQNRERIFMVSILNCEQPFYFPEEQPLTQRLKDVLEQDVDDRYYLSDERVQGMFASAQKQTEKGNGFQVGLHDGEDIGGAVTTHPSGRKTDNYIQVVGNLDPDSLFGGKPRQQNMVIGTDGVSAAITALHETHPFKIMEPVIFDGYNGEVREDQETVGTLTCNCGAGIRGGWKLIEQTLLGWTRDAKGKIVNRHPVDVANCVTAGRRENTENVVLEPHKAGELVGGVWDKRYGMSKAVYETDGVSPTLTAGGGGGTETKIVIPANTADGQIEMELGGVCDLSYPSSNTRRGRVQDGGKVTPALTTHTEHCLHRIESQCRIRKLTERECFRLMGVTDEDIDIIQAAGISRTQQYKMAGNSIVVNCIAAIFRQLFIGNFNKNQQTEIF